MRKRSKTNEGHKKNTVTIGSNEIELTEKVVKMSRVAKVVKGGRRFSFNALTVVGDHDSYVGIGFGKAREVPEAIRKSIDRAKKDLVKVKKQGSTIPHAVVGRYKSARVMLKPCSPGTGIIAGEAVRAIVELGGIQDVLTKAQGSSNSLNIVKATLNAITQLETADEAKERRSITLKQLFGDYSFKRRDEKRKANPVSKSAVVEVKTENSENPESEPEKKAESPKEEDKPEVVAKERESEAKPEVAAKENESEAKPSSKEE